MPPFSMEQIHNNQHDENSRIIPDLDEATNLDEPTLGFDPTLMEWGLNNHDFLHLYHLVMSQSENR